MNLSNLDLQRMYARFNEAYFEGQLPTGAQIDVCWSDKLGRGGRFKTYGNARWRGGILSQANHRSYSIHLSRKLCRDLMQVEGTLLHEMIHIWQFAVIKTRGGHGHDFHTKVHDLIKRYGVTISLGGSYAKLTTAGSVAKISKTLIASPQEVLLPEPAKLPVPEAQLMTRNAFIDGALNRGIEATKVVQLVVAGYGVDVKTARSHVYSRRWTLRKRWHAPL